MFFKQVNDLDDRCFIFVWFGLHQSRFHVIIQRLEVIGDCATLLVVEAVF
jgi:hypothetical protein